MASNTIVLITGANTGLGLEIVKSLCRSSKAYTILLGGRSKEKAQTAADETRQAYPDTSSTIETIQVDIEDDNSISKAFDEVSSKYGRLDALVNNAGAQLDPLVDQGKMTLREMWDKNWSVNTTSTQIMTYSFVPLLLKSQDPRLVFITSGTSTLEGHFQKTIPGPIDNSPPKGWPKQTLVIGAYRAAKCGMNMMMREWTRNLAEDGVKVWCVSPGMLATSLGGNPELLKKLGALDPAIGGDIVRDVVEGGRDQDVGKIVRRYDIQPW